VIEYKISTRRLLGPPKPPEGKPLGFPVEVVETIEGWAWGERWMDGPWTYHRGAILFLNNLHDGLIHFGLGARRPAPWEVTGGWLREADLGKVRQLPATWR